VSVCACAHVCSVSRTCTASGSGMGHGAQLQIGSFNYGNLCQFEQACAMQRLLARHRHYLPARIVISR
jgi:hypothetical protein